MKNKKKCGIKVIKVIVKDKAANQIILGCNRTEGGPVNS